jgi:hypothetical protein
VAIGVNLKTDSNDWGEILGNVHHLSVPSSLASTCCWDMGWAGGGGLMGDMDFTEFI